MLTAKHLLIFQVNYPFNVSIFLELCFPQELQAKLAAQKLSEALRFSTGSYVVEGGSLGTYREVHDDGAQLSSEED